jgi:hypothetical protein
VKIDFKHSIYYGLAYMAYCGILCLIFNPFSFISSAQGTATTFIFSLGIFLLFIGLVRFLPRDMSVFNYQLLLITGIYLIPSIVAMLFWNFFERNELSDITLYLSTFLIIPILPVASYVLWMVFHDLKARVKVSAEQVKVKEDGVQKIFKIKNEKGKVIIEVSVDQIITFEANDNYVITYYLNDQQLLKKSMHRISMKKIEELLIGIEANFLRVHKSYMINPAFIKAVKGRSQAYKIEMEILASQIPVSRSFDISEIQS